MTRLARSKSCATCGSDFTERKGDSEAQWQKRNYCSIQCRNKSGHFKVDIFERLKQKQIRRGGCWGWSGAKDGGGYGIISNRLGRQGAPEKAHRVSYESVHGAISKGREVCHHCDNPECTNPEHLFLGTHQQNMADCGRKGRVNARSIANLNRRKALTKDEVAEIESMDFVAVNGKGPGVTIKSVAARYGVSRDTIRKIKQKRYEC